MLILDNLEEVLAPRAGQPAGGGAAAVAEMALRVVQEAPRTRLVLAVDDDAYARLETITTALGGPSGKLGMPVTMTLPPLTEAAIADIIERSAVQSGTPFEAGLAAAVAADLVRNGPCRPFDLQLAARAIVDLQAGVAAPLPPQRRPRGSSGAVAGGRVPAGRRGPRRPRAPRAAGRWRGGRRQRIRSGRARPGADETAAPRRSPRCRRAGCWSRTCAAARRCSRWRTPRCARSSRTSRSPIGRGPPTPAGRSPGGSRPASGCACRSWSRFTGTCAGR